jgi:hypothetical protein
MRSNVKLGVVAVGAAFAVATIFGPGEIPATRFGAGGDRRVRDGEPGGHDHEHRHTGGGAGRGRVRSGLIAINLA